MDVYFFTEIYAKASKIPVDIVYKNEIRYTVI